jgi:hypothetical protein
MQLPMWRTMISLGTPAIDRAVFSKSTFRWASLMIRKSRPGWVWQAEPGMRP